MVNIDYLTLNAFLEENIDFFIGARVQKFQQPTRRDFILSLRNNGVSRKLYVNINPQVYHVCFMSNDNEERRNLIIPKHPPMFCMLLRKYLEGCKISDVLVVENERIVEFHFEIMDEFSQNRSLCLCVELMGKHSNVILYDRESSIIIGCAHNIGSEKSRYRELKGGLTYVYPPKVNSKECVKEPLYKVLNGFNSVNNLLDDYFSKLQEDINLKTEKTKLLTKVNPKLKKVENSIDKISALLKKRDNTDKYKLYGELLTANLYQKADYKKSIEVFDYINNKNVVIELDETKSLNENAQRYFKLYNKSKTTKEKSLGILNKLEQEKSYWENVLYSINASVTLKDLDEIILELGLSEERPKKQSKTEIMKQEINGYDVYIGRNNKQNDYIVSKLAKDEDFWFHTRLCAGSHVLLRVNEKEPDEATIFECCKLARQYSSATQPSKIGVIYTKAKYLRKPPASPLGYVTYKNEKEILV